MDVIDVGVRPDGAVVGAIGVIGAIGVGVRPDGAVVDVIGVGMIGAIVGNGGAGTAVPILDCGTPTNAGL